MSGEKDFGGDEGKSCEGPGATVQMGERLGRGRTGNQVYPLKVGFSHSWTSLSRAILWRRTCGGGEGGRSVSPKEKMSGPIQGGGGKAR